MTRLTSDLADLLQQVQRPGSFYATGSVDIHTPRLEVEDVGTIALPLLPMQAEQLMKVAEPAPYGRGSETLVDTDVRRTWQVDAKKLSIGGRYWHTELGQIQRQALDGLGVDGGVRAELYKLLVYDAGSFFTSHRDTEKAPGMFATLVIVLPCDYQGGELIIRHKDEEACIGLHPEDTTEAAFAAFYADCRHEVLPITSGHRLTLIYNLIREGAGSLPEAPDYAIQQAQADKLLKQWNDAAGTADDIPEKLIYPLEHAYTQAELGFDTLKGADTAVAAVLTAACETAACDCYLALITIEESGWAEYAGRGWNEDDFEIGEVTDSREILENWVHPDGSRPAMDALPFSENEICPPDALDDLEDAEAEFQEATGNEGVSFERFYQRAALVLWPRATRTLIIAGGGLSTSIPFFKGLVRRWEDGGRDPQDGIRQEALGLAAQIRRAWPTHPYEQKLASESGQTQILFDGLARLGDLEQRLVFLAEHSLTGAYGPKDNPALVALLGELPAERAGGLLGTLIAGNGPRQPAACAQLLRLCAAHPTMVSEGLRPAATALWGVLPNGQPGAEEATGFGRPAKPEPDTALIVDSLAALEHIDPNLARRALDLFLSLPDLYPMDKLLLPAALVLHEAVTAPLPDSFAGLRQAVLGHLEQRIGESLEPPEDWSRPAEVTCNCNYCRDLNRFLAAPDMPHWALKAAERTRSHAESMISRHSCDLDLSTDKRGRPYTLKCVKNQASYQRRVNQRERDLAHRARLAD